MFILLEPEMTFYDAYSIASYLGSKLQLVATLLALNSYT